MGSLQINDLFTTMGLGNPLKDVMRHPLIGRMIDLGYRDGFPIISALVCVVKHWIRPIVSHDLRLSSSHDLTRLLHCIIYQPLENIKLTLKLVVALT